MIVSIDPRKFIPYQLLNFVFNITVKFASHQRIKNLKLFLRAMHDDRNPVGISVIKRNVSLHHNEYTMQSTHTVLLFISRICIHLASRTYLIFFKILIGASIHGSILLRHYFVLIFSRIGVWSKFK